MTRHLLEIDDLDAGELLEVLDLAAAPAPARVLDGRGVALLFEKPSARTRHSTEMAVVGLGGHPIAVRGEEVGLDVRESTEDVARTLACYHAAICARVFDHRKLERMAGVVDVPVVNLLSDTGHPLQAIADLLTIRSELGRLAGVRLAYVGDFNNTALSLGLAATRAGMAVAYGCPPDYGPGPSDVDRLGGAGVTVVERAEDAVKGVDVVYTDTWTSMGQEAEAAIRRMAFEGFTVHDRLLSAAAPHAVVLHCLPAHRGEEVTAAVLDGPRSRVWPQAANRMHAARGALQWLLDQ